MIDKHENLYANTLSTLNITTKLNHFSNCKYNVVIFADIGDIWVLLHRLYCNFKKNA